MTARRNSSWTGRAPRTMQSAFGAYVDDKLHPMPKRHWRIVTFVRVFCQECRRCTLRNAFHIAAGIAFFNCPF